MKINNLIACNVFAFIFAFGASATANTVTLAGDMLQHESTRNAVDYLSGGIGKDEADAFKQAESNYPLALVFLRHAKPKDEFIADVNVSIQDQAGNAVLQTTSEGPFLLAKVPDGRYTVVAEESGRAQVRHVVLTNGKTDRIVLVW